MAYANDLDPIESADVASRDHGDDLLSNGHVGRGLHDVVRVLGVLAETGAEPVVSEGVVACGGGPFYI